MRLVRYILGLAFVGVAGLAGCSWSEREVRPTPPPEVFAAPPDNDPRYNSYHEYPKDVLEQDMLLKKAKDNANKSITGPMGGGGRGAGPGGQRGF